MKRSEAARYARWSATLALLLALATLAVYVQHKVMARVQKRGSASGCAGERGAAIQRPDIFQGRRRPQDFYSGGLKIHGVPQPGSQPAGRGKDHDFLGSRATSRDVIRTHSCQYAKSNGAISCSGAVQIDLQTAAEAELTKKRGAEETVGPAGHVETRSVTFDQASGTARTNERVTFKFPEGSGDAMGVEYNSQLGAMKLLRDVKMTLVQSGGPAGTAGQEVHVTGASLDFDRDKRLLHLEGAAHAQTQTAQLDAGEMKLDLDEDFHARKLLATAGERGKRPHAIVHGNILRGFRTNELERECFNGVVRSGRRAPET